MRRLGFQSFGNQAEARRGLSGRWVCSRSCAAWAPTSRIGVLPSPVSTIIPFAKAASIDARTDGGMAGAGREVLSPTKMTNAPPSERWGRIRAFAYLSAVPPEL